MYHWSVEPETIRTIVIREVAAGTAAIVVAGSALAAVSTPDHAAERALFVAALVGVICAVVRRWRSRLLITLAAVVMFAEFLGRGPGEDHWPYTPLFILSAALGAGYRVIVRDPGHDKSPQ